MLKNLPKRTKIVILLVIIGLFLLFIVRPGITSYIVYQKIKDSNKTIDEYGYDLQDIKSKLIVSETNLSSCVSFNDKLMEKLESASDDISECRKDLIKVGERLNVTQKEYSKLLSDSKQDLENLRDQVRDAEEEKDAKISSLESDYDTLARNTANNLCCKAKVDNHNIRYYIVENNKVVCLEEGTNEINC